MWGGLGIGGGDCWFEIQGEGCGCQGRCNTGLRLRLSEYMSFEVWLKFFLIIRVYLIDFTNSLIPTHQDECYRYDEDAQICQQYPLRG